MGLVAENIVDHVGNDRGGAAEVGMAERVLGAGVGEEFAVRAPDTLGYDHRTISVCFHLGLDHRQKFVGLERHLREQDDQWDVVLLIRGQRSGGGDPAGMAAITSRTNTLVEVAHMDLTSKLASRVEMAMYLATEPKPGQLLVMGRSLSTVLRNMDGLHGIAQFVGNLGHLEAGVGRIAAQEVADVVGLENLDQALVLGTVFLQAFQLEAAGAKRSARRITQSADGVVGLLTGVDQIFGQRTDDAVAPGVDPADPVRLLAGGFDQTAGRSVDNGGHAAGLGVECVPLIHGHSL